MASFCVCAQEFSPSLKKNANAIILSERSIVSFDSYDKYKHSYYRKVMVLNKKAEALQSVYLPYKKGSDKIKDIKITVYDGDGNKIQSVKGKDLEDFSSGDGYSMVTDYRVKYWKYNSNNYPHIVEYTYTKESNTTLSLPVWDPIPSHNVAIVESSYALKTALQVRTKEMNLSSYQSIDKEGNSYVMKNQSALNKEKYTEPDLHVFPAVIFNPKEYSFEGIKGEFDSWNGYGRWIYESFLKSKKFDNTTAIKQELSKYISDQDTDLDIARKIYDYVQDNTRYVSIALDEGGLNPMSPNKVHAVKYGDCKALSLYMHSLLDLYNIKSNYVEVHADSDYPIGLLEDFPSSFPGNHIILQLLINSDTTWVDCTSSSNPFGYLGKFTDARNVLCINESGGSLTKTPGLKKEQNFIEETVKLKLDANGKANVSVSHISHGFSISRDLHLKDLSTKDLEKHLKENDYEDLSITKMSDFKFDVDETIPLVKMMYNIEIDKYAEKAGDYVFIPNAVSSFNIPKLPKDGNRENKIYFPRSYSQQSEIKISTVGKYKLEKVEPVIIESKYGKYTKETANLDDEIKVMRTFELNSNAYPKADYKKIKSFFDSCIKSDRELTTIKKL